MKPLNEFINLMTKVLDFLPRYLYLSEKTTLSTDEEIELDAISNKLETYKTELIEIIPDLNVSLSNEIIKAYYNSLDKKELSTEKPIRKHVKFAEVFDIPVNDWLVISQN